MKGAANPFTFVALVREFSDAPLAEHDRFRWIELG
jgi:hypothetical protein